MPDIVTNVLYAEIDRLQEKVKELEESRDSWKREWRLSNAGLDMAEKRIAELEAENKRLREALDSITTVAKIICNEIPVGTASLYGWVLIGEEALKEEP